ncbi:MAG TPA: Gfo/Idh/MocA family oxidoreductase [Candidatus Krumholzibacteria bacterium]
MARTEKTRIRYAVVGLGYIAQIAVLPAFAHARRNSELRALVSGDRVKRDRLGRQYRVPSTYDYAEFDRCLASGDIDAVYIALPNDMHRAYAEAAARAGVHVLCEKPLAVTASDCRAMIDTAKEHRVKLMTAYRLHFDPANLGAIDIVQSGKLGKVRLFNSVFGMQVKAGNIRLKDERGGGPLYDIGIYCINASRYLFRDEPVECYAVAANNGDARFNEVEESVTAVLRFPGERVATFTCSFGSADVSAYEVVGTAGVLRVDPAYDFADALTHRLKVNGREREKTFPQHDQFAPLLLHFSDCVIRNREPEPSGLEGLRDVRIIEALHESIAKGSPVKIDALPAADRRPDRKQEIRVKAVQRPKLVRAVTPTR